MTDAHGTTQPLRLAVRSEKLTRVWDRDFHLVYTFSADERHPDGLPLDHPVSRHILDAVKVYGRSNVHLSIDDGNSRTMGQLDSVEIVKHDDTPRMLVHWREVVLLQHARRFQIV